jgi:GNAT superfamily N-acetyltransferase
MRLRLKRLLASPTDLVLVAQASDEVLAGWIHGFLSQMVESDYRIEIGGLVIDEKLRGQGIGTDLVRRVESWGISHGALQISVRCRTERCEAHSFYEGLGYSRAKTQIVFRKPLG